MEDVRAAIAENITELRQAANLTQSKLAEILSYSDKAVSKWERGEAVPDITVLKQIADLFGVSVDYLLTRTHDPSEIPSDRNLRARRKNHFIISTLSVLLVWFVSLIVFTVLALCDVPASWVVLIAALPASSVVALVFNSVWGRRRMNFLVITVLIWTLILTAHLIVLAYTGNNLWRLYLVGIPAELITVLSAFIRFKKK